LFFFCTFPAVETAGYCQPSRVAGLHPDHQKFICSVADTAYAATVSRDPTSRPRAKLDETPNETQKFRFSNIFPFIPKPFPN
jgi:hypothetical protein